MKIELLEIFINIRLYSTISIQKKIVYLLLAVFSE